MFGNGTRGRIDKYLDNPHIDDWATNIDFTFAQRWTREAPYFKSSQCTLDASCVCTRILLYLHTIRNCSVQLYKGPDSGLYIIYSLWSTPVVVMGRSGHRFRWARAPSAALRAAPRARRGAEEREPFIHKVPGSTTAARGMGGAERLAQLSARERKGEGAERRGYSLL